MSAFVLNRNYELQLPNNFVDIEKDEMEYVDGGGANYGVCGYITFRISRNVINAAIALGVTCAVAAAIGSCIGTAGLGAAAAAALISGVAGIVAGVISNGLLRNDYYSADRFFSGFTYSFLRSASGFDNQITLAM